MHPRSRRLLPTLLACAAAVGACLPAAAQDWRPQAVFVQAGGGEDAVKMASAGALWPWAWQRDALGGRFTVATEAWVSGWRAVDRTGGHETLVQLGVVPLLRWRGAGGNSPWFIEGGIGLSLLDKPLNSPDKTFGTRWNFSDNLAVGRSFGAQGQHELSLRWQHTSNGGAKKPNPGLDLLMVRYASRF